MAEKLSKKNTREAATRRVVLVATYKGDQLTKWRGWYNYPISAEDKINDVDAAKITELWLFKGTKDERRYKAEFVGIKTRQELIDDYGYPAGDVLAAKNAKDAKNGRAGAHPASASFAARASRSGDMRTPKPHGTHYALFKTHLLYHHKGEVPADAKRVIIRTADFAKRSPKIARQLKAYLESPDRNDPDLAKRLPEIITRLRPDQLRVCEAAVQMEFNLLSPMIKPWETSSKMDSQDSRNLCESDLCTVKQSPSSMMSVEEMKDKIFKGDCLSILPKFPAASVDMILCDLPYGTTQNKWDSVIPLDLLWAEYKRILKPNGSVVLTSQGLFTAKLVLSNSNWFKYKIVWVKSKPTNFLNAKVQPLRKHEDVCVFYGHHCTYNPVMGEGVPYDKGVRKNQLSGSYGDFRPVHVQSSGKRYPTDVVYFKTAESEGEVWHPTQKPVELGRYLVKTFSNPGDLILDNAFGSGSFLVAAALENRHFVGIEKNESVALFKEKSIDYIEVAKSRLDGILKRREVS